MQEKLERFVSSLTDREIDNQLADIFEWAKLYKELLEKEQAYRQMNSGHFSSNILDKAECDFVPFQDEQDDIPIDYKFVQMMQQKVSALSVEKTREQLEILRQVLTRSLDPEEAAKLKYAIESCELHLFELIGETVDGCCICPSCGAELESNAKFCGKCGAAIK